MALIPTGHTFHDSSSGIKLCIFTAASTEVDYFKIILPEAQRTTGMNIK